VTTETVAVERVSFGKQDVTEQQTVRDDVRKERIEVELPDDSGETAH
jgi:stress response protein YsnF